MAVEFLTDEQAAEYGVFAADEPWSRLERRFYLDEGFP